VSLGDHAFNIYRREEPLANLIRNKAVRSILGFLLFTIAKKYASEIVPLITLLGQMPTRQASLLPWLFNLLYGVYVFDSFLMQH